MIILKNQSIIDAETQVIVHQCNCVSTYAAGLAKTIFDRFSYADVYSIKHLQGEKSKIGTFEIRGDGKHKRFIINLFGQYYPGYPKYANDTAEIRLNAFKKCLSEIYKIKNLESIAFPYEIGCGLAGGNWKSYYKIIEEHANSYSSIKTYIYKI